MPENTSAGAMPAVAGATPTQTPPPTAEPTTAPPATGAATEDAPLGEAGRRALEQERTARRDAEGRAKAAEERAKALEQANMTDAEKQRARLAELEANSLAWVSERQTYQLQIDVGRQAARLGFTDPADAIGLIDRAAIEYNTDGTPKNTAKLLEDLVKAKPYLVRANGAAPSFDTGTGGGRSVTGRTYTRQELRDTAFYAKNRADIELAGREGRIRG